MNVRLSQDSLRKIRIGGHTRVRGKMGWEPGRCSRAVLWTPPPHPPSTICAALKGACFPPEGGGTFCTFLSLSFALRRCFLVIELDIGDHRNKQMRTSLVIQ